MLMMLQLARQHFQSGRLQDAQALYQTILRSDAHQPEALHWLGALLHQHGAAEQGIGLMKRSIEVEPNNALFHYNLGFILQTEGRFSDAVASFRQAVLKKPDWAEPYNNLGIALVAQGKFAEAVEIYQSALVLQPTFAKAHNNLGNAWKELKRLDDAIGSYRKALTLLPNYAEAAYNLGNALIAQGGTLDGLDQLRRAVALKPDFFDACMVLSEALLSQGLVDEARSYLAHASKLKNGNGARVAGALLLPQIMGTKESVLTSRHIFEHNLNQLIADRVTLQDPIKEHCSTNFYLAYQGENDKELQQKVAHFYAQACPSLLFESPHCSQHRAAGRKLRIGFLSKFIYMHSVAVCFSRLIEGLAAHGEFDVALISNADHSQSTLGDAYPNFSGRHVHVATDLQQARVQVASLELDVLVYLDIGMDPFSYFLAFSRLARVQCVLAGHPDTTGIGALDYYLSADSAEPHDADEHYSEKLVRLPFGFFYFNKPVKRNIDLRRENYFLPSSGSIYLCPVTLFKIHPDFDAAIERILEKDPNGFVVFIADKKVPALKDMLSDRFNRTINQRVRDRAIFIPWVEGKDAFMGLIELADVVLDPFHFGIGSTGIPIFTVGTPYVTLPSKFMRGRVGLYFYELTGVRDCIALDLDDYVNKAVRITNDHSERDRIKSLILANNDVLFENQRAVQDFVGFVQDVTGNQN